MERGSNLYSMHFLHLFLCYIGIPVPTRLLTLSLFLTCYKRRGVLYRRRC
uniref:Uncharacterized protein n=1 Tax=Anguilla anguilla TaxID=7936 RepID=A0A0E9SDA9_ANGAN